MSKKFNANKIMAEAKFYESYSRYLDNENRYETWNESVNRVMEMHRTFYADKLQENKELSELLSIVETGYQDKLFLGSQRALQFGGEQLLKNHNKLYNCFKVDTAFVTNKGVKTFEDFKHGDVCVVKTHKGNWKRAVVKNYGVKELNTITFSKGGGHYTVEATSDHRWILSDGSETTSLKVGDKTLTVDDSFSDFEWDNATSLKKLYWCYGFIYGDGAVGKNGYSQVRLCRDKVKYEKRFLEMGFKSSSSLSIEGDVIISTGLYKKTIPNPDKDGVKFITAFVRGYMDADGSKNGNHNVANTCKKFNGIQCSSKESIELVRKIFPIAGVYIMTERDLTGQITNYGKRPNTINFSTHEGNMTQSRSFKVIDIKKSTTEEVWCLEVEDDASFVLSNGMVTGNCSAAYIDRVDVFGEVFHLMLSGCGVGFSVQKHHIAKVPELTTRTDDTAIFIVEDSIEGWAHSVDVLLSSFFACGGKHPEYHGKKIYFDLSKIRPKGAMISGGFKAPGPEGLRVALDRIELMLIALVKDGVTKMPPIVAYDIIMFISDAVISGGVRRSAAICMFSPDDDEMLNAKTGDWWINHKHRGRSNNSAVLLRGSTTKEEFDRIMVAVKDYGEPGFIWVDSLEVLFNPCCEISLYGYTEDGRSGFSFCNLSEINGGKSTSKEVFFLQCKLASIIGTLQAGYTDFKFVSKETKEIVEREALLGVSITGWMNNPEILFDDEILEEGARIAVEWNKRVAKMLGINQAARVLTVKPSGNASVLLGTSSGIHGEHSKHYFRHVQFNKESEIAQLFIKEYPDMVEQSVYSDTDIVVAFPIIPKDGSIYKKDLLGVKQLEYVVKAQESWVNRGKNHELCVKPYLNHNVSNTITVDDWDEVGNFIFDNRQVLGGVSLLSSYGDKAYTQAPFTEVLMSDEILAKYGEDSLFTSALIEVGLTAFNNDLWLAINTASGFGETLTDANEHLLKRDFVRRFKKFSTRFNNVNECAECLKDVYNLHKWVKISNSVGEIDWKNSLTEKKYTDVDTIAAEGCAGGKCDI